MRISDWSSDVCSSDLDVAASFVKDMLETCLGADAPVMIAFGADRQVVLPFLEENHLSAISAFMPEIVACRFLLGTERSEERRVGKECVSTCRSRWSPYN